MVSPTAAAARAMCAFRAPVRTGCFATDIEVRVLFVIAGTLLL
jgi:hypothetical protein